MTQKIIIWDENREYAIRLMNYLNRYAKGRWIVMMAASQEELKQLLQQNQIHAILSGPCPEIEREPVAMQEGNGSSMPVCFQFTEQPSLERDTIYYYDSARQIQQQLEERLNITVAGEGVKLSKIVGVLAVVDTYANRCRIRREAQVQNGFYWEMTAFSDYADKKSGEKIVFSIKMREEGLSGKLRSNLLNTGEGSVMTALESALDYRELNREDILWFWRQLEKAGYETVYVYMDLGTIGDYSIWSCFEQIWVLSETAEEYRHREDSIYQLLELAGVEREQIRQMP